MPSVAKFARFGHLFVMRRETALFERSKLMTKDGLRRRAQQLQETIEAKTADVEAGLITKAAYHDFVNKAAEESKDIKSQMKAYETAARYSSGADASLGGAPPLPPGGLLEGAPILAASPMDLTPQQVNDLMSAAQHRTPYSVEIQPKSFRDGIGTKTVVSESGLGGSFSGQLPPVQSLYAVGIGYEPTRVSSVFPGAAMPGPSATWLSHTANSVEVAAVAEAGTKADISPTITENQVIPTKIAGQVSVTLEAWQDTGRYGEASFASWLPAELTRSLVNAESSILLNAVSGTSNATFNGILNTSGTLTRSMGTDTPLDCLAKAYADVRVGAAFADPDLVLMHPNTLGALRRQKDADGRYLLDLLAGPMNLTAYGQPNTGPTKERNEFSVIPQGAPGSSGTLWGANIFSTTQIAAGTAVVASVKAGAGIFWQRLGLLIMFDPYSLLSTNAYRWVAEERIAYSCPRPAALNIVTGLPTA
jgi:hypothetical protein